VEEEERAALLDELGDRPPLVGCGPDRGVRNLLSHCQHGVSLTRRRRWDLERNPVRTARVPTERSSRCSGLRSSCSHWQAWLPSPVLRLATAAVAHPCPAGRRAAPPTGRACCSSGRPASAAHCVRSTSPAAVSVSRCRRGSLRRTGGGTSPRWPATPVFAPTTRGRARCSSRRV